MVYELKRRTETPRRSAGGEIILIGGSAGSTEALPELLKMLDENRRGADLPPIAASLHMPSGYTKIFAQRLDGTLGLRVKRSGKRRAAEAQQRVHRAGLEAYADSGGRKRLLFERGRGREDLWPLPLGRRAF